MLHFFGRRSAFYKEQNSAFFIRDHSLILIDCPMSTFHKLVALMDREDPPDAAFTDRKDIKTITILVTHTHGDHVGGIAMLIFYAFYVWHIPVTVAAPSAEVAEDLRYLIERLEGCEPSAYTITSAGNLPWVRNVIPTEHTPALSGRCFGYRLDLPDEIAVYTGDTCTLAPFLPYLSGSAADVLPESSPAGGDSSSAGGESNQAGADSSQAGTENGPAGGDSSSAGGEMKKPVSLYTEAAAFPSPVHLAIKDILPVLQELTGKGIQVYLMHMDDEEAIGEAIRGTEIRFAPLI